MAMNGKELRARIYGDFEKWLADNKFIPSFSNDVWALKLFDVLHEMYSTQRAGEQTIREYLQQTTTEDLEKTIARKKEQASIQKTEEIQIVK